MEVFLAAVSVNIGVIALSRNMEMARTHGWNRLQFSLRALLLFTILVAVYISYLVRLEANRNQLVREIEAAGGIVTSDEALFAIFSTERITAVTVPHNRIQEIGASKLKALPKLTTLSLTGQKKGARNKGARSHGFVVEGENNDS